jgi:polyphosphate glucokinase
MSARPKPAVSTAAEMPDPEAGPHTLAIDIGGSHLKAGVLDPGGNLVSGPERVVTPDPATPQAVIDLLVGLAAKLSPFARISIGFPGVVRDGTILTAPNLGTANWHEFPLARAMTNRLECPTRVLNDASIQGLGVIAGTGLECVITLGTGMGFALFCDGHLMPHMEMGQHNAHGDKTYDHYVGDAALKAAGRKRWNKRVRKTIAALDTLLNYDTLYIGGGNATRIEFELPENTHIVSNQAGVTGGVRLWAPVLDDAFPNG